VGPNSFSSADCVYGCPTVRPCNWGLCKVCYERCDMAYQSKRRRPAQDLLQEHAQRSACEKPIQAHFSIVQLLNQLFSSVYPFADLTQTAPVPGSLAYLLLRYRGLFYEVVKMNPICSALDVTASTGPANQFDLVLSRSRARKHAQAGLPDRDARYTVFAQAFRAMHGMPPAKFRRADRLYSTKFSGEHAVDGGGPYR
jgi:hypothetical protein